MFLPDGVLTAAHLFTLERLRRLPGGLLVIVAAPSLPDLKAVREFADAFYWKALAGYDFSAYAIVLREIAKRSSGADLFIMNDSVFGPFYDVQPLLDRSPAWDLTGFTASWLFENHLQSYAFFMRTVTEDRIGAFGSAIPFSLACDQYRHVINLQETRFARLATRKLSVGAMWYADPSGPYDPTLFLPFELIAMRFPFLKKSLTGRLHHFQNKRSVEALLEAQGHPR